MPKGHAMSEATKEGIWELRAQGLSEHEIARQLGLGQNTVSFYLRAVGGIRPRPRRRSESCLSLEEREEISRGIARGHSARAIARELGRSHTTIIREINRCGGRRRYRAHAADREALAALAAAASDQARALPRAWPGGLRAPSRGPLPRADRRLASLDLPRQ
jgi:IS30 family transposase